MDVVARRPARAAARASSGAGSPIATARRSSTSTSGSSRRPGRSIPEIFEDEGEAAFRRSSGRRSPPSARPTPRPRLRRVISTGGGAIVDPRNRWALYRGRTSVWLDGRPEVLAQRLRRSPHVRPLVTGRDPIGTIRDLAAPARAVLRRRDHPSRGGRRGAAASSTRSRRGSPVACASGRHGTTLLRAATRDRADRARRGHRAPTSSTTSWTASRTERAILVSEPGAWAAVGERLAGDLRARGRDGRAR